MVSNGEQVCIVIEKLKQIGVLKYGDFLLKSGTRSHYYCDFKTIISYPKILESIYELIPESVFENVDLVCGVYFGGVPLCNMISFKRNIPQIYIRDSEKTYGTKKQIEGNYNVGQTVLLVEDVITTGGSILEKMRVLCSYGLNVVLLTMLNRNSELTQIEGYPVNSVLPLQKIIENQNQTELSKIYNIAFQKKSNIILSVDLNTSNDIIHLIEQTKEYIVGVKIHSDIIYDFELLQYYLKTSCPDLLVIEDCKVADISFISIQKVKQFAEYADYITYHCLLGPDLPISLKREYPKLGLLGVVEMSVKNSLIDTKYIECVEPQLELMDGCVIQSRGLQMFKGKLPITFSPGISITANGDEYNQTYKNPLHTKNGIGEFWIIGRSIYQSENSRSECEKYRDIGWKYFLSG